MGAKQAFGGKSVSPSAQQCSFAQPTCNLKATQRGGMQGHGAQRGARLRCELSSSPFAHSLSLQRGERRKGTFSQVPLVVKNSPANAGAVRDTGSIPGSGRSPGGGNGNLLQYPCLENSMDRGVR